MTPTIISPVSDPYYVRLFGQDGDANRSSRMLLWSKIGVKRDAGAFSGFHTPPEATATPPDIIVIRMDSQLVDNTTEVKAGPMLRHLNPTRSGR